MKEIVKLPREIWLLIFEYKQANFERQVRAYVESIFMYFPKIRSPHASFTHEDLLPFRLRRQGDDAYLMYRDVTIDAAPIVWYFSE